jgi:hypothetical protein
MKPTLPSTLIRMSKKDFIQKRFSMLDSLPQAGWKLLPEFLSIQE